MTRVLILPIFMDTPEYTVQVYPPMFSHATFHAAGSIAFFISLITPLLQVIFIKMDYQPHVPRIPVPISTTQHLLRSTPVPDETLSSPLLRKLPSRSSTSFLPPHFQSRGPDDPRRVTKVKLPVVVRNPKPWRHARGNAAEKVGNTQ